MRTRHLPAELRRLSSEAYSLWRKLAAERANPYGDHSACLLAGRMAVDATAWEDGLVVLDAIRVFMDEKSSPRRIPEWSRDLGAQKRARYRNEVSKVLEKQAVDDLDPEVRRVMIAVGRAKAAGKRASLDDVTCAVCKQFTEGKCPSCRRALHERSCPTRHECAA